MADRKDRVCELECNIDDMTPEELAFAAEQLMKAGARAISKDNLMHVHHLFESSTVLTDKRSMTNLERANKRVMEAYYKEG